MISEQPNEGDEVLVRCVSCLEGSPTVVVASMVRRLGRSTTLAYARIRSVRPRVVEELRIVPSRTGRRPGERSDTLRDLVVRSHREP